MPPPARLWTGAATANTRAEPAPSSALKKVPALLFQLVCFLNANGGGVVRLSGAGNQAGGGRLEPKQARRTLEAPGKKHLPVISHVGDFPPVEFKTPTALISRYHKSFCNRYGGGSADPTPDEKPGEAAKWGI